MSSAELGDTLAAVNASLNATSAVALLVGYIMIRRRALHAHRARWHGALASMLFLFFYVTRWRSSARTSFAGEGGARTLYFAILFSHMASRSECFRS